MKIENYLKLKQNIINKALLNILPKAHGPSSELTRAIHYSILAGGKRIRPILMLEIADMLGKSPSSILPAASAIEYIHTSTLILDDLPCMDNSNMRRGRQSVHKRFGESTAILASYSLVALGFELLIKNAKAVSKNSDLAFKVAKTMSDAIGFSGVCSGQYVDLKTGAKRIKTGALSYLHEHKTADLFAASCEISGYLSGAGDEQVKALRLYGKNIGLAFQIYDDILSLTKSETALGKQTKADINAPNFVNLFGYDKAQVYLERYINQADMALDIFGKKADLLRDIVRYLSNREY